jgi:hypothetical protein
VVLSRDRILAACIVALAPVVALGHAHADPQLTFRIGVEPLSLRPSADTPFVGGYVGDAVAAYNEGSALYNQMHGYSAGSPSAVAPIDASALGLDATLTTFAPGIEFGGLFKFRGEALVGTSSHVHAFGIGVYPIDIAIPLAVATPYVIAGVTARYLSRSDLDGGVGALGTARIAAGARVGHIVVELGYSLYMLGGIYNSDQLHAMTMYDPRGNAPPPPPDHAVAGGTQTGMVDVSVGFTL